MSPPLQPFIAGFNAITPAIWEYIPSHGNGSMESLDMCPDLILLFSWTGANGRHVSKYTEHYKRLFPFSAILIFTTSIKDLCFRSAAARQEKLQPALNRLLAYGPLDSVLLHCFSEGGSNKMVELAEAYHKRTGSQLPATAVCLDSTPGIARYSRLCSAFSKTLPNNKVVRATGLAVGGAVIASYWAVNIATKGDNDIINTTRRRLDDPTYWNATTPRCYLYSKKDEMVHWEDVQAHAEVAATSGRPTLSLCFEESAHCKHVSENVDAYWEAVTSTWRVGLSGQTIKTVGKTQDYSVSIRSIDTSKDSM